jgi:guanylate kinase
MEQDLPGRLAFSVSATTRPPRAHESHGNHYYFLETQEFQRRAHLGHFLEWEEVYPGRYYGTLLEELQRIAAEGKAVLFDVDVNGALSLKSHFGPAGFAVFVQPPSVQALRQRLESRGTEAPDEITRRMARAEYELAQAPRFDYVLLNDDLTQARHKLRAEVLQFLERFSKQ